VSRCDLCPIGVEERGDLKHGREKSGLREGHGEVLDQEGKEGR